MALDEVVEGKTSDQWRVFLESQVQILGTSYTPLDLPESIDNDEGESEETDGSSRSLPLKVLRFTLKQSSLFYSTLFNL